MLRLYLPIDVLVLLVFKTLLSFYSLDQITIDFTVLQGQDNPF